MDGIPDYSQYSTEQLSDILARIIKEEAPDHYWLVVEELARRLNKPMQEPHFEEEARPIPEPDSPEPSPILQLQLLNAAQYGSMGLLFLGWLIYEENVNPTDKVMRGFFMLVILAIFAASGVGFTCMRDSLRRLEDEDFALHQSLVALFWAPSSCLIGTVALFQFVGFFISSFPPLLMLGVAPLCLALPFLVLTFRAKKTRAPR